jgi:CBS domain-containing protein
MRDKLRNPLEELRTLRDEIRLDLHLASLDLRDEWRELEKKLPDPATTADAIRSATTDTVSRLALDLKRFRARLRNQPGERTVAPLMSPSVAGCAPSDSLAAAAMTMWDADVGSLPVLDGEGRVVGVITDRDMAMAAATRGRRMDEITVESVAAGDVCTCRPTDSVSAVLTLMRTRQVRRLPVVDDERRIAGIVTLNDAARAVAAELGEDARASGAGEIVATLAAIAQPRTERRASDN